MAASVTDLRRELTGLRMAQTAFEENRFPVVGSCFADDGEV